MYRRVSELTWSAIAKARSSGQDNAIDDLRLLRTDVLTKLAAVLDAMQRPTSARRPPSCSLPRSLALTHTNISCPLMCQRR